MEGKQGRPQSAPLSPMNITFECHALRWTGDR
jgi:hypothetical protein